jgi:antirestriction protein ArdC
MAENANRVKEITDKLEAGIQAMFDSEAFKKYLKTLSKFHHYSVSNTILIAMQRPDATLVAGYSAWKNNFGRQVKKGEQGIKIIAPAPFKKQVEIDGEMQEVVIPSFKVVNVFDVSQTEGRELPSIGVNELTGDVSQYKDFYKALEQSCPVPIEFKQIRGSAKGYFDPAMQRIAVQEGMSQVQTVKTLIHEMAHQKLHSGEQKLERNVKEVEAEAVAYTVSQHFGIDTSDYSFAYIAGWSKEKTTEELKASLDRIRDAADEMITSIEDKLHAIQKEKVSVLSELKEKKQEVQKAMRSPRKEWAVREREIV